MFTGILKQQLLLKGVITESDWMELFHNRVRIDFYKDNHYTELKDGEVLESRFRLMDAASSYIGDYISKEWALKTIMRFTDEELDAMKKDIEGEIEGGDVNPYMPVPGMAGDQGAVPPEAIVGTDPDLEMPDEEEGESQNERRNK
jgi:hypothetical protein